jgi:hypothetical protein
MKAHIASGVKHPDNMTRQEKLQRIQSFPVYSDAVKWWLTHAAGSVSRKAFEKARNG